MNNNWICVKKQLPEYDRHVLVYGKYYDGFSRKLDDYYLRLVAVLVEGVENDDWRAVHDFSEIFEVTHWQELPDHPAAKEILKESKCILCKKQTPTMYNYLIMDETPEDEWPLDHYYRLKHECIKKKVNFQLCHIEKENR